MADIGLYNHQIEALQKMKNGCILNGGVGSGKSRTALAYFYKECGGNVIGERTKMTNPIDLYIITTARKRDSLEWEGDMLPFNINTNEDLMPYKTKVVVDSWNNIKKYDGITNSFFIFDEQRVVGGGVWAKTFIKLAKKNKWILLSATPGDKWEDYISIFIANGFFKNKTEFLREHVVFARFSKYPKVERYLNTKKLERLKHSLLVDMDFERLTTRIHEDVVFPYDRDSYKEVNIKRWNIFKDEPIINASELCYTLRKVVNTDKTRLEKIIELQKKFKRIIVFYNFNYELDLIKEYLYCNITDNIEVAEYNGHKHEQVPNSKEWIYLVQYTSGCEAWNCITTNCIIFYSQNYSYKVLEQSCGRIDRLNTPYKNLYYYHFKSRAPIDKAIGFALRRKKDFNEKKFVG